MAVTIDGIGFETFTGLAQQRSDTRAAAGAADAGFCIRDQMLVVDQGIFDQGQEAE